MIKIWFNNFIYIIIGILELSKIKIIYNVIFINKKKSRIIIR